MPNWYLGAVLVTAPFFIKIAPFMTPSASWMFYILTVSILSVCLWGIDKGSKVVNLAAITLFITCLNTHDIYNKFAFSQMITAMSCLLFFSFCMGQRINKRFAFYCLSSICLLETSWIGLNMLGIDPFSWILSLFIEFKRESLSVAQVAHGSLGHINQSGALVAITMPFLDKRFWIFPIVILGLTGSMLPIICSLLVVAFYFLNKIKKADYLWPGIALLAIVSIFMDGSEIGTNNRFEAWKSFLSWHDYSVLGNGFGYIVKFGDYYMKSGHPERFHQLHNELLEVMAVFGLPGLVTLALAIIPIFKIKEYCPLKIALSVALVNCLGNFTLHIAPIFIVISVCYALLIKGEKHGSIS